MTNKDLISQYIDTGIGIPIYQYNKLSNNDKRTYDRKMLISMEQDAEKIRYYYGELPEDMQFKALSRFDYNLDYIKNPTEAVKIYAVQRSGAAFYKIENPSEAVKMAAVKRNDEILENIDNPSEAIQLAAVTGNGTAIQYLYDKGITPSNEVQIAAVKSNASALRYIKNPSDELQIIAVEKDGRVLERLPNASEAVQLAAIKNKPYTMMYINNPSEAIQSTALRLATTDVDHVTAHSSLISLYPYISDENKLKVVNYLLGHHYIGYVFYEKSDDNIKRHILNRIFSDKIIIDKRFYEVLPEDKKLDYLKMEIDYTNETKRFLGDWVKQEYKKLTGIELVKDKISRQYVERND
jgi:hypothetical protein